MSQEEFKIVLGAQLNEADLLALEQRINEISNKKVKISLDSNSSKETEKNVNNVNNAVKQTTKSAETFGQKLKNAFKISTVYSIAYKAINSIRQAANNAVNSVKELNQSLTNLRIVTNSSQTEAEQYMNTYNSMARELGATTTEVADAATDWLRQGKSISETNQLIQDSMKLSKVGMIDSADATQYLTSALNGYRLEANQATSVVDKLSKLDSSAAITAGGLAEAMSRTAVSADSTGVSMDRLLGYLATVGEVTQENMSVIGNAFKTFFARYTSIKTGKLELIDEDGTTETLSNVEQSLKNVGIDMRSTITDFDNAGDVLDNLYAKWDSLNGVQQNAIANAFGGVRQKERFLALMENYDKAKKYMDLSANSAGAAEEKFGAYLDGIEAKSKSLQAAFESLANNTISSELIGNIKEAAAALVTFIDKSNLLDGAITGLLAGGAVKLFTMLKSGVSSATIQLNEFNSALQLVKTGNIGTAEIEQLALMTNNLSNSQLKAVLSYKALSAEQRIAILTSQGLSKAEATAKISALGLATSEQAAAGATSTLGGAFKGLWATLKANPLILIIGGVTAAISAFNTYQDSIKEAQQAAIDTAKESTDHIKELESSLKSYLELDTTATEADKASALKSVTEQINNKTKALKNATEAEKGYVEAVKESIVADYDEAAKKARDARVLAEEQLNKNTIWDSKGIILWGKDDVYNNIVKPFIDKNDNIYANEALLTGEIDIKPNVISGDAEEQAKGYLKYYETLLALQDTIRKKAQELGKEGDALLESNTYKAIMSTLNDETFKGAVDEYVFSYSNEVYDSNIAKNGIPETVEQFNTLKETMLQQVGDSTLLADTIKNRLNSAFGSLADEATKANNKVSNLDFTIDTETFTKQLEEQQDEISKIADNYKKISGVIDDYNANGSLSIENLETLISVGDDYVSTLFDENGKLNLNKDSYAKLAKAKLEDIRYSMLENAISSLNQLSKDDETTTNNELAESTGKLTEETLKLVAAKKLSEGVDSTQIQNIINTYSQWSAIIDNVEAGLENNINATLGLSNASDTLKDNLESEKKALENSKSALEDKKKALEDTKDNYENAIDSVKSLIDWTEKYIKQTKDDEIKSLEDKKKSVDDLIESQKELLQAQKDEYNWNKEISKKQNEVAKNALAASIASLNDSSAGKKTYKEAIDTLNESRSEMADSLYEHSIDTRMDALDKLKEQSDEYYDSEIDKINKFLDDEVALYKSACSMIDNDNGTLYSNLLNYCKTYTTTSEAEFNHMWTSAQSAMQQYNIANLDTFSLLNDLQGRIYEVDTAIDTVAENIQSYEDRISGVQSKLDNLSNSAQTAINNINAALNAENELNKAKWYYDWQGSRYESNLNNKDSAIQDIIRKIENQNGGRFPASAASIYGTIKHYAKGTRNAKGGVSQVNEEGLETLMKQTPQGDFVVLNQGDQVFTKEQTDNLQEISRKPAKYIYDNVDLDALAKKGLTPLTDEEISNLGLWANYSDVVGNLNSRIEIPNLSKKVLENISKNSELGDNINQNIRQNINYYNTNNIHGDVTPQMLRLLEKKEKEIIKKSADNIMDIALSNRKFFRSTLG